MIKPTTTRTARGRDGLSGFERHTGPVRILITDGPASAPDHDETQEFPVVVESPGAGATAEPDSAAGSAPSDNATGEPVAPPAAEPPPAPRLRTRVAEHPPPAPPANSGPASPSTPPP